MRLVRVKPQAVAGLTYPHSIQAAFDAGYQAAMAAAKAKGLPVDQPQYQQILLAIVQATVQQSHQAGLHTACKVWVEGFQGLCMIGDDSPSFAQLGADAVYGAAMNVRATAPVPIPAPVQQFAPVPVAAPVYVPNPVMPNPQVRPWGQPNGQGPAPGTPIMPGQPLPPMRPVSAPPQPPGMHGHAPHAVPVHAPMLHSADAPPSMTEAPSAPHPTVLD
jgi:hypothetical protein